MQDICNIDAIQLQFKAISKISHAIIQAHNACHEQSGCNVLIIVLIQARNACHEQYFNIYFVLFWKLNRKDLYNDN